MPRLTDYPYIRKLTPPTKPSLWMHSEELLHEMALTLAPGVGNVLSRQLIGHCGSAREVFRLPRMQLRNVPGIGAKLAEAVSSPDLLRKAEAELLRADSEGVRLLRWREAGYPEKLRELRDAPLLLYRKGADVPLAERLVALVGTRKATEYGLHMARRLVEGLAAYEGAVVVSGLAYGVDVAAHRACLEAGLPTVGVMASGMDTVYPARHRKTAEAMLEKGGLLTEYPFGTKPDGPRFPARNRLIAGLADAVVVVESGARGGSLITAEIADSYGRAVLAVPGDARSAASEGCNDLLRKLKAQAAVSAEDVAAALGWPKPGEGPGLAAPPPELHGDERAVYEALAEAPAQIDGLSYRTGLPLGKLAGLLLELEFKGVVRSLPGKQYALQPAGRKS